MKINMKMAKKEDFFDFTIFENTFDILRTFVDH